MGTLEMGDLLDIFLWIVQRIMYLTEKKEM